MLTFSLVLQISPPTPGLAEVSAMLLARRGSLLPLLPVRPARVSLAAGLRSPCMSGLGYTA